MISDEPVRGRLAPPWMSGLDGLERLRLYATNRLPGTPMARLLGSRVAHIAPGLITMTSPASPALLGTNGQIVIAQMMENALYCVCETVPRTGFTVVPRVFTMNAFRPVRPLPGNLLARARVVNASRYVVFGEVFVEDSEGRSVAHGSMHAAIVPIEGEHPEPPSEFPVVEEAVYDSPDPYLRSYAPGLAVSDFEELAGEEIIRKLTEEQLVDPAMAMFSLRRVSHTPQRSEYSMTCSEWYCNSGRYVDESAVAAALDWTGWMAALGAKPPGGRLVALETTQYFFRRPEPDGRLLNLEGHIAGTDNGIVRIAVSAKGPDGELVATSGGAVLSIEGAGNRAKRSSERILTTLLFSDIVDSTEHARRLGDNDWRALLERHYAGVRREISRYGGVEVSTSGDGFFVRFASPARAVEAACAIRSAAAQQRLAVRIGVHTGECEIEGNRLSGIAVHTAARIQAAAEPGEILVSSTVYDLVSGGSLDFEDRGEFDLKGLPGRRKLLRVIQ